MTFLKVLTILSICVSVSYCFEDKTVFQYLNESGYTLFARLVQEANLDTTLDGNGPFTVLAPTNAAVATLDPDIMVTLGHNDLLLKNVIRYHILDGFNLIPEFKSGRNEVTLNGQSIVVSNVNNTVLLNNASTITSNKDVILKNGVVHPINAVLIPPVFSTNNLAAELIKRDDMFQEFTFSLLLTNMTELLEKGEYTIFAPTNKAFTGSIGNIFYLDMPNIQYYHEEMLRYHIVPGARSSSQLKDGQILYTLHGTPIHITIDSNGFHAENTKITQADIGASNGVIHVIDRVLFPDDLRIELEQLEQQMKG